MVLQLIIAFSWFFTNSELSGKNYSFPAFLLRISTSTAAIRTNPVMICCQLAVSPMNGKTSLQKTDNEYTKQCSCDASYTTCHGYTTDDCSTDSLKLKSGTTSRLNCSEDSGVCDRSKSCEESTDYICCNMIESYINSGKSCCFFCYFRLQVYNVQFLYDSVRMS